jgi:GT2 family glycosyltransferase
VASQDDQPTSRPDAAGANAASAPAVLAIVVAHDPGEWFDETLESLAAQDHPRLGVLVLDTSGASTDDQAGPDPVLAQRVAAVLPRARVERVEAPGFGQAANIAIARTPRASLLLLLHDDVALAPDVVSLLVAEVREGNAGIVGPKLVHWDEPDRLLHVGLGSDRFAVPVPVVDGPELDQQQYDTLTDTFAIPGGCMLIRTDLFREIGGYDPDIAFRGDDIDLCWRAQIAGARVVVVPGAVARHRADLDQRRGADLVRRERARHEIHTVLTCSSWATLLVVVPQLAALTVLEAVFAVVRGRFGHARAVLGAWWWNVRHLGPIRQRRALIRSFREVRDRDVRRIQSRGSARLRLFLRGQLSDSDATASLGASSRGLARSLRARASVPSTAMLGLVVLLALLGSRHLLTRAIPAIGEMQLFAAGPRALLSDWWRGWHAVGGGSSAAAPTGRMLLALTGVVTLGHMGLARTLLVLLPLVIGPVGMWRFLRLFGSARARAIGTMLYLGNPLPWNAVAAGSWSTLVLYAAMPWMLGSLALAMEVSPLAPGGNRGRGRSTSTRTRVLAFGVLLAFVAAAVPAAAALALVIATGLALGSLLVGSTRGLARLAITAVGGALVAAVLHGPWTLALLRGGWGIVIGGADTDASARPSVGTLLRFGGGPIDGHVLGYALFGTALLALIVADGWRLEWAVRAWSVALVCWATMWTGGRGWLPFALPPIGVLLAPAAAGLAVAVAMGVLAVEVDLPARRFGWRQPVVGAGAALIALSFLPFAGGASSGRWSMPRQDFHATLSQLGTNSTVGGFRTVWLGDPRALPVPGLAQADGTALAVLADHAPGFEDRWPVPATEAIDGIGRALDSARGDATVRLGRLLAPYGVRYLVLPERRAPDPFAVDDYPLPSSLTRALATQLDLERVQGVNTAVTIYRNNAWFPTVAILPDAIATAAVGADDSGVEQLAIVGATPALGGASAGSANASGPIAPGSRLYSSNASGSWTLHVGGQDIDGDVALASAGEVFTVPATVSGSATLSPATSVFRHASLVLQIAVWLAAMVLAARWRERDLLLRSARASSARSSRRATRLDRASRVAVPVEPDDWDIGLERGFPATALTLDQTDETDETDGPRPATAANVWRDDPELLVDPDDDSEDEDASNDDDDDASNDEDASNDDDDDDDDDVEFDDFADLAAVADDPALDSTADLDGADLDGADLDGADLDGADLDGADLDDADPDTETGPTMTGNRP